MRHGTDARWRRARRLSPLRTLAPAIALVASCVAPGIGESAASLSPCAATHTAAYCERVAAWVRHKEGLPASLGLTVAFRPLPSGNFGAAPPPRLVVTTADGREIDEMLPCGGVMATAAVCYEAPPLFLVGSFAGGYWDTTCDPNGSCQTPVVPDAAAVAAARPLRIASLAVPVGSVGHHEIEIGRAALPNGVLTSARLTITDTPQSGYLIDPVVVRLELRSLVAGRPPFTSVHERGRFPGVEEVAVLLTFDVAETSPGAAFHISGVDIH